MLSKRKKSTGQGVALECRSAAQNSLGKGACAALRPGTCEANCPCSWTCTAVTLLVSWGVGGTPELAGSPAPWSVETPPQTSKAESDDSDTRSLWPLHILSPHTRETNLRGQTGAHPVSSPCTHNPRVPSLGPACWNMNHKLELHFCWEFFFKRFLKSFYL